jgi:hypothetical protein
VSSFRWKLEARVIRETMGLESRVGVRFDDGYYLAGWGSAERRAVRVMDVPRPKADVAEANDC